MSAPADVLRGHLALPDSLPDSAARVAPDGSIENLIGKARAGDAAAFATLVARFEDKVYGTTFGLLQDREDALDAVQETFVRLYKYLDRFDVRGDLGAWLYRIAVNVSLRMAGKRKRALAVPLPTPQEPEVSAGQMVERDLARALETLTQNERTALVLRDFEGLTTEQVAEVLGSSPTTVRVHICAARKKLRRFLDQPGQTARKEAP